MFCSWVHQLHDLSLHYPFFLFLNRANGTLLLSHQRFSASLPLCHNWNALLNSNQRVSMTTTTTTTSIYNNNNHNNFIQQWRSYPTYSFSSLLCWLNVTINNQHLYHFSSSIVVWTQHSPYNIQLVQPWESACNELQQSLIYLQYDQSHITPPDPTLWPPFSPICLPVLPTIKASLLNFAFSTINHLSIVSPTWNIFLYKVHLPNLQRTHQPTSFAFKAHPQYFNIFVTQPTPQSVAYCNLPFSASTINHPSSVPLTLNSIFM